MKIGIGSICVAALLVCGVPGCVGESGDTIVDEQANEPQAETLIDADSMRALAPDARMLIDLTHPGSYSLGATLSDLDLQRIDVQTKEEGVTPIVTWLGEEMDLRGLTIDAEGSKGGPTIISFLNIIPSFTLSKNTIVCFDVGWVAGGGVITVDMIAQPKSARVLVRRKVTLSSPWSTVAHPGAAPHTSFSKVLPAGYYQVCAESASSTSSTGIKLAFDAPTACGPNP